MRRLLLTLVSVLALSAPTHGQSLDDYNMLQYKMEVKQIAEFMERFNLSELPPNLHPDDTLLREKAYLMLFDRELIDRRQEEVRFLVQRLAAEKPRLSFTDTAWCAEAVCRAVLDGKPTRLTLVLRTEHVTGHRFKWVISDARGECLALTPKKSNPGLRINPTDNEVNFLSLHDVTKNEWQNILNYKASGTPLDGLSVFFALVQSGRLKIEYVEDLAYHFWKPSYQFTVRDFRRDDFNAGWLISDFTIKKDT